MEMLSFRYEYGESSVVDVGYHLPVQLFAAGMLDCVRDSYDAKERPDLTLGAFEVIAPFDLGGRVYEDVNPILAVLSNIVCRGLPTRCSPFVEEAFAFAGNVQSEPVLGAIAYELDGEVDEQTSLALQYSPIGVARLQKTIIEALIAGVLDISKDEWRVVVVERDVPCAAIAFEDLRQMLEHLSALSTSYKSMEMPKVDLTVVSGDEWSDSPLHLDAEVCSEPTGRMRKRVYDMVVDISVLSAIDESRTSFSEFIATNDSYFVIGNTDSVHGKRTIYTSDTIEYEALGSNNEFGSFVEDPERLSHLRYFLNLLFRKEDFREGQVNILNRALTCKNVIGLLPTGGGKSLTYQLAAMLQPGVTLVVDPLRALMQDQHTGLVEAGIDACTYINSTLSQRETDQRVESMAVSEAQFVFVAPERLCMQKFRRQLANMDQLGVYFAYGVIDEVHCVSEWGHDFRFSYLHLGRNLYKYVHPKSGRLTLFGLTATASFDVLADVERELSGDGAYSLDADTVVRHENTDRLELQYKIERIPVAFGPDLTYDRWHIIHPSLPRAINPVDSYHKAERESKSEYLAQHIRDVSSELESLQTPDAIELIKQRFKDRHNTDASFDSVDLTCDLSDSMFEPAETYESAGIVFCPHRQKTSISVAVNAERLQEDAGIPDVGTFVGRSDRDDDQDAISFENMRLFKEDKLLLMVATKAFGMGIDKPNVRFSVNMNYPTSLESFVQEAGRAGRDRKMALAKVLVSDYSLARIRSDFPSDIPIVNALKNRWFYEADLHTIVDHYGLTIPRRYVDIANPDNDLIENADYATNRFFYEQNFVGAEAEKRTLYEIFCKEEIEFLRSDADLNVTLKDKNLIERVLSCPKGTRLVACIPYKTGKEKPFDHVDNVQKMIYRMSCIGFVDDFIQDYYHRHFLVAMVRLRDGGYYESLKHFLMRYYAEERADELVSKVPEYRGENEVQKCLGFLTEFTYDKIAVKRKRAMDDMRQFCNFGSDMSRDWREINEDLKDYIYFYFNSKYARDEYVADNGEPFSLTIDTDRGKLTSYDIVLKYLRVVDEDLVGAGGTPIDNIKHLQGAVRLIRRALTDYNPTLALLNFFCLTQLGTNGSESLENELKEDYRDGMLAFMDTANSIAGFWRFFNAFRDKVWTTPHRYDLQELDTTTDEIIAKAHLKALNGLAETYLGNETVRRDDD